MANKFRHELFERLYGVSQRIWVYFFGLIIASIIGNLVYEFFHNLNNLSSAWKPMLWELITIIVLLGVARQLNQWYKRQERKSWEMLYQPVDRHLEKSYRGLIWILSPFEIDHAVKVINKHVDGFLGELKEGGKRGKLEVCWCIMARMPNLEDLTKKEYENLGKTNPVISRQIRLIPVWVDRAEVNDTFEAVNKIYEEEILKYNKTLSNDKEPLKPEDVIADITSGLRSMSAGMLLACLRADRPIEYLYTVYDTTGKLTGKSELMFIETSRGVEKIRANIEQSIGKEK